MDNLSRFVETLSELLSDEGIVFKDVERVTGCSAGNISMWLSGKVAPTVPALIRLSDFFGCSIEYLLGRSDTFANGGEIVSDLASRLNELASQRKKSLSKIAKELGMYETMLYRWKRAEFLPNLNNLIILADYFGCTTDYLIGRKR